ncbi:uncharacterized protein LOC129800803 [Phlebotomus papatasi]|uniref:uncharacterized protein LOC129800803 n=1 Tax=Phlebotomus papatasi TaxID=29031 RepID=UPI0024839DE0|nr:uncharacterized protein LOC129800803 [Phlebotomus papatasi]
MNFMIVFFLLIGAANLSIQSPIVDNNAEEIALIYPDSDINADDDLQPAENHIFRPFFRYKERSAFRRRTREVTPEDYVEVIPEIEETDDLQPAENHIFRPFFRYKERVAFRRRTREASPEEFSKDLPELPNEDSDLQTAENHIFIPYFRYKERRLVRHRGRRSIVPENVPADLPQIPSEDSDDLQAAENHIFVPYFRYKERQAFRHRGRREAIPEDLAEDVPQIPNENDLGVAENHYFKPIFRYQKVSWKRAARDLQNQEILSDDDAEINPEDVKSRVVRSADSELSSDGDDLEVAENHIFQPVFRYKQRAAYRRRVKRPVKTNRG